MCYSKLPEQVLNQSTAGEFKGKPWIPVGCILMYWASNTFQILLTPHKEMASITCSMSYVTMNNSRLLKCHVSGSICTGFLGARLPACNQLTRELFMNERTEWVWWSAYSF